MFGVFSFVRTKLPHYTMPAFPCIALWLAGQISAEQGSFAWFQKRFVAMAAFILALTLAGFSIAQNYLLIENVWHAAKLHIEPQTKVACYGYTEPGLVWKFRGVSTNLVTLRDLKTPADFQAAQDFLTNTPPLILVLPTTDAVKLATSGDHRLDVSGLDMVKFKNRDLTLIFHGHAAR